MSTVETVASHRLAFDSEEVIVDTETDLPFDIEAYSRMKYGDREAARQFAGELTGHVLESRPELVEEEKPPRFAVPFSVVPPVPFYLSRYALESINAQRSANGLEPGSILRIDKSRTQTSNYAVMSARERQEEVDSIQFFFPRADVPLRDAQAVILDDLHITGTVIRKLLGVFDGYDPQKMMLGFVAIFEPTQALQHPEVEDRINGTTKRTVDDVLPLIQADNFDLNIRTLKMILSTAPDKLMAFLEHCPSGLLEKMHKDTADSGRDFVDYHAIGYQCLGEVLRERA